METARVEISRCISGLGLRSASKNQQQQPDQGGRSSAEKMERHMSDAGVRRGSVMEKVANVFCSNNSNSGSASSSSSSRRGEPLSGPSSTSTTPTPVRKELPPSSPVSGKKEKPPVPPRDKTTVCRDLRFVREELSSSSSPSSGSSVSAEISRDAPPLTGSRQKPVPPEKPSRFSFQKMRNGMLMNSSTPNASNRNNRSPRASRSVFRHEPVAFTPWNRLWQNDTFLERFFDLCVADDPLEICTLSQVCRKWRDVLYRPRYWRRLRPKLDCKEIRQNQQPCSSDLGLERRRYLQSLQLRACDSLCLTNAQDEDICDLMHGFPAAQKCLQFLQLRGGRVSDKALEQTLDHLHALRSLELSGCNDITDAGLWSCLHPRLVVLTITDCINIADESVAAAAQLLPALQELNLQAYHVTDAALACFSSKQSCSLTTLRLHSCWELTNHAALNIANCLPNLSVLSFAGCSKITDEGIEVIAENIRGLKSLDLSWCSRVTDAALEYIACDLAQLEELVLDRCIHVSDIGIGYLSTMASLRTLSLRWCSQIRDFGLQHLCSMRNMRVLSLAGCTQLTSEALSNLIQLRHLSELELTNCPASSTELSGYLRDNLPQCWVYD